MKWRCRAQRRVGNVTEMAAHSNTKGAESAPLPACRGGRFAQGPGQDRREAPPAPGAREGAVGWAAARQPRASRPSAPGGPFPHVPSSLSQRWGVWGSRSGWNVSALSPWALWTPRVGRFCAGCWVAPGAQWSPGVTPKNVSDTVPLPRAGAPNRPRQSIANLA